MSDTLFSSVDALDSLCDYGLSRDVASLYRAEVGAAEVFVAFPEWYGAFGRWQGLVCEHVALPGGRFGLRVGGQLDVDAESFREAAPHDALLARDVCAMAWSGRFDSYERQGRYDLHNLGRMLGINGYGLQFPDDASYEGYDDSVFSKLDQSGPRLDAEMVRLSSAELVEFGIVVSDGVVSHRLLAPGVCALLFDPSGGTSGSFFGVLVVAVAGGRLGSSDVVVGSVGCDGRAGSLSAAHAELGRLKRRLGETGSFEDRMAALRCEGECKRVLHQVLVDVRTFVRSAPQSATLHFDLPPAQAVAERRVLEHLSFCYAALDGFGVRPL